MASFHNTVRLATIIDERWTLTFNANADITALETASAGSSVGKAVTIDPGAANKVRLAKDGDRVVGRIEVYEGRNTGAVVSVATKGIMNFTKAGADTINVGDSVVGSTTTDGLVEAAPAVTPTTATPFTAAQFAALAARSQNVVVEVSGNTVTVMKTA